MTFGPEDQLHLLQLMARRAISERRAKVKSRETDDRSTESLESARVESNVVPTQWRLLPDGVSLYAWQQECLPIWMAKQRGTVKVATGGGKTLFALAAAQALQNDIVPGLRAVVVVPTIPLMWQWYDEVRKGNLPVTSIGLMGGGQELPPLADVRILICVLNSARERLPELVRRAGWSSQLLLVVDECHRTAADQASRIFETNPRYTLGLSATPEPGFEDGEVPADEAYEQGIVGRSLGPIIYEFTLKQSMAAGLLTPFEVWHIGLQLTNAEAVEHGRLSRDITELRKSLQAQYHRAHSRQPFIAWCQTQASHGGIASADAAQFIGLANRRKRLLFSANARSEAALGILTESLADEESMGIVFHESIPHIEELFLRAVQRGLPALLEHSDLPDSLRGEDINAFRQGVARVIVSAKSLIEGFNVPSADLGIIAASSSSVRQRIQSLGRMLRRKAGNRHARIFVLYVADTEDEAIYEKADWEAVIGAERNRYFTWQQSENGAPWPEGLVETEVAPRRYRPPSSEVDVSVLKEGDTYPGQSFGQDVRVDKDGNLRDDGGTVFSAPKELVEAIVQMNGQRRARITPAGHLVVRVDSRSAAEPDWRFLGIIGKAPVAGREVGERLKLSSTRGRRVIARDEGHGVIRYAQPGAVSNRLLAWVQQEEMRLSHKVTTLYWEGGSHYWLVVGGERIDFPEPLDPLDFGG